MSARERALEAVSEALRVVDPWPSEVIASIERAGLVVVEAESGDGAGPATAREQAVQPLGAGPVGLDAEQGDHAATEGGTRLRDRTAGSLGLAGAGLSGDDSARWSPSRAQVFSDEELEEGDR